MKTPTALQPLIDDGVIDEVIRALRSGKEATVYLVRSGTHTRCAKVYRDMRQRSFQRRARYQEGRKLRGSRQTRAANKSTRFGRSEQEAAWKNAEVDALYRLQAAGVRVPKPFGYFNDVLIMELVTDAEGNPAPRLGEVNLSAEQAREYHEFLIRQVVRMLKIGLIHGDLSEFNVLVASDGPVIIDLPQVVNAAGNNGALAMLERDVNNIRGTLARFAPELLATEFAREMWSVYERGELTADIKLTGRFASDETLADSQGVLLAVNDAREEAIQRQLARQRYTHSRRYSPQRRRIWLIAGPLIMGTGLAGIAWRVPSGGALAGLIANLIGYSSGLSLEATRAAAFWVPASFVSVTIAAALLARRLVALAR